ncbi:MAG TPA: hypothetical protein VJN41_05645, partial [Alphaproteobacteria bacterium]|nr:hypothetical protein [Alphaproteobacteria bacterium]
MLKKIAVIGGGNIGGVVVQELARRRLARLIAVVDVAPMINPKDPPEKQEITKKQSVAKGKALDIIEGGPIIASDVKIIGSKEYDIIADADMVINTAGVPRKPKPDGTLPSREELLSINLKVTSQVADAIAKYCKSAFLLNIANPLDAIVYTFHKKLNPPKQRIVGMAGVLDSARLR